VSFGGSAIRLRLEHTRLRRDLKQVTLEKRFIVKRAPVGPAMVIETLPFLERVAYIRAQPLAATHTIFLRK
jgi:hypothetical protein